MRVEKINDRYLLCDWILKDSKIKPGQVWARADGAYQTVTIIRVHFGIVTYRAEGDPYGEHIKAAIPFQSRYCLVLKNEEIPEEITS